MGSPPEQRRRTRFAAGGALAGAVVIVGALLVAASGSSDGSGVTATGSDTVDEAATSTTSTTSTPDVSTTDTGLEVPAEATVAPPTSASTSTTTTTSPPPTPPTPCPAPAIELAVTTERAAYEPGDEVVIRTTATNRAGRDCAEVNQWEGEIHDQEGRSVAGWAAIAGRTEGDWRWPAGDTRQRDDRWDQQWHREEGSAQVTGGTYTVTITWRAEDAQLETTAYTGQATFTIADP